MARPLRLEIPNGWYHVMNRGLRRHSTFTDKTDHEIFLQILAQACQMFNVKVGAYCLMPNHYHLLVKTPNANLSRFMRHVNGVYTQRFNRLHSKDGPLFRGRYRALIVEADTYLLQVVRYIHLNPVKAKLCRKPEAFRWSSHRQYIKPKEAPDWMNCKEVLTWFSTKPGRALALYREFIHEPQDPQLESFYKRKQPGWILGDEKFTEKMKARLADLDMEVLEEPQARKAQGEMRLKSISKAVMKEFKVSKRELMESQRGKLNLARNIALSLSWEHSGLTQQEIAEYFGARSYRTVAGHHHRLKKEALNNKKLARQLDKLKQVIVK